MSAKKSTSSASPVPQPGKYKVVIKTEFEPLAQSEHFKIRVRTLPFIAEQIRLACLDELKDMIESDEEDESVNDMDLLFDGHVALAKAAVEEDKITSLQTVLPKNLEMPRPLVEIADTIGSLVDETGTHRVIDNAREIAISSLVCASACSIPGFTKHDLVNLQHEAGILRPYPKDAPVMLCPRSTVSCSQFSDMKSKVTKITSPVAIKKERSFTLRKKEEKEINLMQWMTEHIPGFNQLDNNNQQQSYVEETDSLLRCMNDLSKELDLTKYPTLMRYCQAINPSRAGAALFQVPLRTLKFSIHQMATRQKYIVNPKLSRIYQMAELSDITRGGEIIQFTEIRDNALYTLMPLTDEEITKAIAVQYSPDPAVSKHRYKIAQEISEVPRLWARSFIPKS